MTETEKGVYWIATEDNGINIYDSITGTFRLFDRFRGLAQTSTACYTTAGRRICG